MLESAVLFLVFFGPLAFGCVEPWSVGILQAVMLSLPVMMWRRKGWPVQAAPRSLLFGMAVILALGAVQALHPVPPDGPLPLLPFTASAGQTRKALLLWASYAVLVWIAPNAFMAPRAGQRFAWAVVLSGFTVAVAGLIQAAYGNKFVLGFRPVGYGRSPFGPYYNNGHAASFLAVCALMGLGLLGSKAVAAYRGARRGEPLADQVAMQAILAVFVATIIIALFSTHNRGSLLAFGGASLIVGLLACGSLKTPARRWGARAVILAAFLSVSAAALQGGFLKRGASSSVPVRLSMYQSGLRVLGDAPLWGTGLGTVIVVFAPYKAPVVDGVVDHVHNDWLELPIQAGLPAATLLLVGLAVFGRHVYAGWLREPSLERRLRVGGGIAAATCFLLHAMVEFTWQIPANAVVFLLILSWLWNQTRVVPGRLQTTN